MKIDENFWEKFEDKRNYQNAGSKMKIVTNINYCFSLYIDEIIATQYRVNVYSPANPILTEFDIFKTTTYVGTYREKALEEIFKKISPSEFTKITGAWEWETRLHNNQL